jgi:hypothetical protein
MEGHMADERGTNAADAVQGQQADAVGAQADAGKLYTQAEVDRMVSQGVKTREANLEKELAAKLEAQRADAERMASLSVEQRLKEERDAYAKELAAMKNAMRVSALKAHGASELSKRGLDPDYLDALDYSDTDTCMKSIERFVAIHERATKKVREELLKGKPPIAPAPAAAP